MKAKLEIRHPMEQGVTLASLIRPGIKVCLVFPHGLGDVVMFRPILKMLRRRWSDAVIHMSTKEGLEALDDHDESIEYDVVFWLDYYMATAASADTKNTLCCRHELGVQPPLDDQPDAPRGYRSPLVGIGCTSISMRNQNTPSAAESRELNEGVLSAGFIPVDTAMTSCGYEFKCESPMACSMRGVVGTYPKLAGLLERCYAFIGTISGAYHVAQSILPGRTLMLCPRAEEWRRLYKRAPLHINMRDVTADVIREWLLSLPEKE